ncbi:MAG: tRNA (adenosine(37)-N6)-threonylcarbamoyltransferase complex dimerization subunit type 1 TsaB [Deltaproteobacteria bacterium]|nr:MAG: tRNA (adenosine(37)-N6)-threonylcarbamoyltransferase complex dimerization subunit type 1 TsaB [Deltaproteobacteria bacterium]
MKILAIETSTLTGSVALLDVSETEKKVLGEISLSISVQHSERLLPMVDHLLSQCSCTLEMIDLFAVSVGPGSFTGLRIGIAAAQGFSLSTGKSLVGVSTLKSLAMNVFGFSGVILPLINAFRGEVYAALYLSGISGLSLLGEEGVIHPKSLRDEVAREIIERDTSFFVLGNGVEIVRNEFVSLDKNRLIEGPVNLNSPRASTVALLAYEEFQKSSDSNTIVVPNYLRIPG